MRLFNWSDGAFLGVRWCTHGEKIAVFICFTQLILKPYASATSHTSNATHRSSLAWTPRILAQWILGRLASRLERTPSSGITFHTPAQDKWQTNCSLKPSIFCCDEMWTKHEQQGRMHAKLLFLANIMSGSLSGSTQVAMGDNRRRNSSRETEFSFEQGRENREENRTKR